MTYMRRAIVRAQGRRKGLQTQHVFKVFARIDMEQRVAMMDPC